MSNSYDPMHYMEVTWISTDRRGIRKALYIFPQESYSGIEKDENNTIGTNLNGREDCHTKWSKKTKTERELSSGVAHMQNLSKTDRDDISHEAEEIHRLENPHMVTEL